MPTRTANLPIGLRRLGSDWNKDLPALLTWAKSAGYESIDLNEAAPPDIAAVRSAGLRLGSVDLLSMGRLLAKDPGERNDVISRNVAYIKDLAAAGVSIFFTVLVPDDPTKPRPENYTLAVDAFAPLAQAAADAGVRIAIEGWPGPAPHFQALCCTPESCRNFLGDTNPNSVAINYDPSHLIRLGVDPLRFLQEFVRFIPHVHAKDTEFFPDAIYELGLYQDSIRTPRHRYGAHAWRYTIPGHGQAPWSRIFRTLHDNHYRGVVSVELEDENFNGSEEGEKEGLLHSLNFLRGA
jgi:sugar phosphate isomerase/epimerase